MSHSPGPWKYKLEDGWGTIYDADGRGLIGCNEEAVFFKPEDKALMTAAPDMLAMLEELREINLLVWRSSGRLPKEIEGRLNEVIRKARGEE